MKIEKNMKIEKFGIAAVCGIVLLATSCRQQTVREQLPVNVNVVRVRPVDVGGAQAFSGTVEESAGTTLSFPVTGTVRQICVEPGQRVARGALIAVLDESSLRSAYDAAAAALEQAEDAYSRMRQLHESGSLPEMQWVEVQSRLRQAQSVERISKKNLADGRLIAPFAGVISEKHVEMGQNVMPGSPVAKLVAVDRVKVCVSVPENDISSIRKGQSVIINVPALGGKTFQGKIVEKGISADRLSRSYTVKALVENPQAELMPGMICELSLNLTEAPSAIVLPNSVICMDSSNNTFVWINSNGKAQKRMIKTGALTRYGVTVVSGLNTGDEVIVEGQQKVSAGMNITIGG